MVTTSSNKKATAYKTAPVEKATTPKLVVDNSTSIDEEIKETAPVEVTAKKKTEKEPVIKNDMLKKETIKKITRSKTTTGSKEADKKTSTKTNASSKEANVKTSLMLQYQSIEVSSDTLIAKVKDMWKNVHNKSEKEMKNINLYIKPEEYSVYYVINNSIKGRVDL